MKRYIIIISAILNLTRTIAQNTNENSPDRSQDPCARPQIETNPFEPKNTEWYSQLIRFNWMDYVTPTAARTLSRGYLNTIPCYHILAE